jgi:hypothetical protein
MITRIEIKFLKNPQAGQAFAFNIAVDGVLALGVQKVFGTDIAIGVNVAATVAATLAHLVANDTVPGVEYSAEGNSVYADFETEGYITVFGLAGALDYVHVYELNPESNLAPFVVDLMGIEIIDTYENSRVLYEEVAQASALKLSFDGGDDLYQPMMTSKISFNMYVPGGQDGHFLHLLTGDERRFMVRLRSFGPDGFAQLLWQGYILPDLYSEPYQKNLLFVSFTATDMLALLKGKTFKPWYYDNLFNLPELLGLILAETGLSQQLYVSPALVNVSYGDGWQWRNLNIDLRVFRDGKKYDDLYAILEKILTAQGLQLVSWRGKWHLRGLTRRAETVADVEVYYPDGVFMGVESVAYAVLQPKYVDQPPMITAETPWKKVNVNYKGDAITNLFPDDVVVMPYYSTRYRYDQDVFDNVNGFVDRYNWYWDRVSAEQYIWTGKNNQVFKYRWAYITYPDYSMTEAQALENYFECKSKPFVISGQRLELEMEVRVDLMFIDLIGADFIHNLETDVYNKMLLFQILVNDEEFLSNRPGYALNSLLQFEKQYNETLEGGRHVSTWTLKYEFAAPEDGVLSFRFLAFIGDALDYGSVVDFWALPKVLRINTIDDPKDTEDISAVRDINYTKELDYDIDILCSAEMFAKAAFGIAPRLLDRIRQIPIVEPTPFYDMHIKRTEQLTQKYIAELIGADFSVDDPDYVVYPAAALELTQIQIDEFVQDYIFRVPGRVNSVFLDKADGTSVHYNSLYTKTFLGEYFIAVYNGFIPYGIGRPKLPDSYDGLPVFSDGDALMLMQSLFGVEDKTKRALWKIYGFPDGGAQSYAKTLAYACHAVRPAQNFSIDTEALDFVFPLDLPAFPFLGARRKCTPTRLDIDLFKRRTIITMKEAVLGQLTDITYE